MCFHIVEYLRIVFVWHNIGSLPIKWPHQSIPVLLLSLPLSRGEDTARRSDMTPAGPLS